MPVRRPGQNRIERYLPGREGIGRSGLRDEDSVRTGELQPHAEIFGAVVVDAHRDALDVHFGVRQPGQIGKRRPDAHVERPFGRGEAHHRLIRPAGTDLRHHAAQPHAAIVELPLREVGEGAARRGRQIHAAEPDIAARIHAGREEKRDRHALHLQDVADRQGAARHGRMLLDRMLAGDVDRKSVGIVDRRDHAAVRLPVGDAGHHARHADGSLFRGLFARKRGEIRDPPAGRRGRRANGQRKNESGRVVHGGNYIIFAAFRPPVGTLSDCPRTVCGLNCAAFFDIIRQS